MTGKYYYYKSLAIGIIEQGLKDLKYLNKRLERAKGVKREHFKNKKEYLLKELRSDWCRGLIDLDIEVLIKGVEDEHERVFRTDK